MILSILMILLGLSTILYSFFEIRVWGSLYFARDYHCIERLRRQTKLTDLVSCMHNAAKCVFGIVLLVAGLKRWIPEGNWGLVQMLLVVSFILLVTDVLVLEGTTRAKNLRELRLSIEKQWHSEKRYGPEHDHEVNLYRGTVRVTQQYPRHIIIMGVCMLVITAYIL
jgi:hypothetical protein